MDRIFSNSPQGPLAGSLASAAGDNDQDFYEYQVRALIADAIDFEESNLSPNRETATRYYQGVEPRLASSTEDDAITGDPPLEDEEDAGRSTVVSTDVRDTVMSIMPSLMRMFMGTEHAVEYVPNNETDVDLAVQATDYVRMKLWQHNEGFMILHGAFKDALTVKMGIVTWWTDRSPKVSEKTFNNVTQEQFAQMMDEANEGNMNPEVMSYNPPRQLPDGSSVLDNLVIRFTKSVPQLIVKGVPPEEFRVNRDAKSIDDADLVGHECYVRIGTLVGKYGMDYQFLLDKAGTANMWSPEKDLRNPGMGNGFVMNDYVKYGAFYVKVDKDGDGINELRLVITIGEDYEIVSDDIVDYVKYAVFGPDPTPHTLVGESAADLVMDIQRINTNLLRSGLDSLTQSVFPRTIVNELLVNIDDALNDEIGAIIRTKGDPLASVQTQVTPFVGQSAFDAYTMMGMVRQSRTGISEASKGVDPKALQSTTMMGVDAIVTGAQERIELIARIFAEGGMKRLYKGLLREIVENPNDGEMMKLRGKWVPVKPSLYDPDMGVNVNPALGKGSDQDRLAALTQVKADQTALVTTYGLGNGIVGVQELYNTAVDILDLVNIRNHSRYFKQPTPEMIQAIETAPKEPSPELLVAQSTMEDVKSKTATAIGKQQTAEEKVQVDKAKLEETQRANTAKETFQEKQLVVDAFLQLAAIAKDGILADAETDEYVEPRVMLEQRPLQPHEIDEMAADAAAILSSPAFKRAFDALQKRYYDQLLAANVGDLTVPTTHASMRVLEDVKQQLTVFINDAKMKRSR